MSAGNWDNDPNNWDSEHSPKTTKKGRTTRFVIAICLIVLLAGTFLFVQHQIHDNIWRATIGNELYEVDFSDEALILMVWRQDGGDPSILDPNQTEIGFIYYDGGEATFSQLAPVEVVQGYMDDDNQDGIRVMAIFPPNYVNFMLHQPAAMISLPPTFINLFYWLGYY